MKKFDAILAKIPVILSSKVSIFIYLLLFFYLVIYALLCAFIPAFSDHAPSGMMQLIMGNYTNVLSALGASIAAGAGVAIHSGVRRLHQRHDELQKTIALLHEKIDRLEHEKNTKSTSI